MQVSVENIGALGRKLTVRLPSDELDATVRSRIQEMSRTARINGFRPGKVPPRIIEQRFGDQIRGEELSELIGKTLDEAITKESLRPAMQPVITSADIETKGQVEYVATFDVLPQVDDIDVGALEISRPVTSIAESDIDEMIETLRMQRRSWDEVERAAQADDLVLLEYSAQGDGFRYPEEDSDRIGTIIGSGALFEAFETALVGRSADEQFDVELEFPEGFRVQELAGQKAAVSIRIVRVEQAILPEVDEEFAAAFGVTEGGVEKFRDEVKANLERELKGALTARLKTAVVDGLVDAHADMDLPETVVLGEARRLAGQAGIKDAENADDEAIAPFLPSARKRVAGGILLAEVARQNSLQIDDSRVQQELATIASTYEDPQEVIELYLRDPQMMGGLRSRVLEDQVAEWIADHAKTSEQVLSFNELMRPGG